MATNRYGDFNTQPLYNVTGRLNRGPDVAPAPFQAPNSGASRQWASNQGMPSTGVNPIVQSLTSYWSPINMYDMARMSDQYMYPRPDGSRGPRGSRGASRGGRRGAQGTGEPNSVYLDSSSSDSSIKIGGDINFAAQNEGAMAKNLGGSTRGKNPAQPSTIGTADTAAANQVANPQYNTSNQPAGGQGGARYQGPQAPGGASITIGNVTGGKINQPPPKPRAPRKRK